MHRSVIEQVVTHNTLRCYQKQWITCILLTTFIDDFPWLGYSTAHTRTREVVEWCRASRGPGHPCTYIPHTWFIWGTHDNIHVASTMQGATIGRSLSNVSLDMAAWLLIDPGFALYLHYETAVYQKASSLAHDAQKTYVCF